MKENKSKPQKPDYRLFDGLEIQKEGVTLRVELYTPVKGTGSLKGRLLRLMEQDLQKP